MAKIKVHLKAHRRIFKNRVDTRIAQDDRDGVGLEIIAGLTLLAFEVEARFNFLGAKLIADWDERAPAIVKVKKVCKRLVIAPNFSVRPYLSVATVALGSRIQECSPNYSQSGSLGMWCRVIGSRPFLCAAGYCMSA